MVHVVLAFLYSALIMYMERPKYMIHNSGIDPDFPESLLEDRILQKLEK